MRNKISALIIDPQYKEHDYTTVTIEGNYKFYKPYGEKGFDLKVVESTENIEKTLNDFKGVDCIITLGDQQNINFAPMNALPFEFRKKWIHIDEFNAFEIANSIIEVFLNNINRERPQEVKLFSIFTCTFNTPWKDLERLHNSLKNQIHKNWNWYILDDSTNNDVITYVNKANDPRIVMIRNFTNHGNIGFNKHMIAMACDGDYLVEVDHDDELTYDCLYWLNKAFTDFPDSDFVYSHAMEEIDGRPVEYGNNFAYGLGKYADMEINGKIYNHIALTALINSLSVRGIHALPNHVRCWKSSFYHKIGGHNIELAVLDDMDILIRTFLYGKMTLVDKVLYIQHEGTTQTNHRGDTTQSKRFLEIQRTNELLRIKYDKQIHEKLLELGVDDPFWINESIVSDIHARHGDLPTLCNVVTVSQSNEN